MIFIDRRARAPPGVAALIFSRTYLPVGPPLALSLHAEATATVAGAAPRWDSEGRPAGGWGEGGGREAVIVMA